MASFFSKLFGRGGDSAAPAKAAEETEAYNDLVLVAAPLLPRLRRAVHRALYGDRADPVRVVSRVGAERAVPGGEFHGVVGSIRSTLRLPYVALRDNAGRLTESGTPARICVAFPMATCCGSRPG